MMNTTRWSPDTCDCIIDFEYDADLPLDQQVYEGKQVIRECQFHKNMTAKNHWKKVHEENTRKNTSIGIIIENAPPQLIEVVNGDKKLKDGELIWSFDENRKLKLSLPNADNGLKTSVQAILNAKHGKDSVDVI